MNSWRSWVVFAGAVIVYLTAVTQRTTFGIVGVEATDRFGVSAATLSSVAVVQVATYAALQIPVGVLVDRLGPRVLLIGGATIMALGQVLLAFADDIGLAIAARVLVGTGDAFTFVSVLRLLPNWFSGRILPQLAQWVGMIGATGQLVAAIPFCAMTSPPRGRMERRVPDRGRGVAVRRPRRRHCDPHRHSSSDDGGDHDQLDLVAAARERRPPRHATGLLVALAGRNRAADDGGALGLPVPHCGARL